MNHDTDDHPIRDWLCILGGVGLVVIGLLIILWGTR